jgi:hypothetical protein
MPQKKYSYYYYFILLLNEGGIVIHVIPSAARDLLDNPQVSMEIPRYARDDRNARDDSTYSS